MEKQEQAGDRRRVVVIGGGVAGSFLAKSIQFLANVTLIDSKEYFEIPWANLRATVEPSFAERSVINHTDYLTNARIVTSSAVNITETEVLTADGQLIAYDYLVIATGHADAFPKSRTERLNQYKAENQKINSAQSILIVGGVDPDCWNLSAQKQQEKAVKWLTSKKVELKLEQRVNLSSISDVEKMYQTSNGETINADCYFVCTGKALGSTWIKETILKDDLDNHGRVKVDEYLKVKGRQNIFAIGDITDIPELKQGYLAKEQAQVAAKNLKLLMGGGKESKMATYKPHSAMAIVSLGRKDAVAQFPFMTISGRVPGLLKSGDLFVGKTRKDMGLASLCCPRLSSEYN
ncbi:putative Apoptosis-inducing factor [Quillaja saponaria]|uniref:Apoptosis-inducing factor n=1 Tax=Quillaja saponaria TaxID=32244 RepID=A0AAD7QGT9_QUISA|nr:putative Apoptosis-inducing factor [Quillaja saponaria]